MLMILSTFQSHVTNQFLSVTTQSPTLFQEFTLSVTKIHLTTVTHPKMNTQFLQSLNPFLFPSFTSFRKLNEKTQTKGVCFNGTFKNAFILIPSMFPFFL